MKRLISFILAASLLVAAGSAQAWWGNRGWDGWNDWPVWTPMYWAEEMFDDNDWYGPYGYQPYYGGYPYGGYGYPGIYGYNPYYRGYGYPGYPGYRW